jgi:hypothetical protein
MQPRGDAHDVDDGVERAYFMEVDFIRTHAVDVRLGICQIGKDAQRRRFDRRRQTRLRDDGGHVVQMAVGRLLGRVHVHARAGQPAACLALRVNRPPRYLQGLEQCAELGHIQPGITQCAQDHVAAYPRKTVEIDDPRHCTLHVQYHSAQSPMIVSDRLQRVRHAAR